MTMATNRLQFAFGENWKKFSSLIDDSRILQAERAIQRMLKVERLDGCSFLDVGCGSGLSSLAAHRLGARVSSFDIDPLCVACTSELKRKYGHSDKEWSIAQGSALDRRFLTDLGTFDIVYSWGVLHHTGDMWNALDNVIHTVAPSGTLFIALYNDQGYISRRWTRVKQISNRLPRAFRFLVTAPALIYFWGPQLVRDTLRLHPTRSWREYGRGMSPITGIVDWVGGYPFEVAKPEEVFDYCSQRGLQLKCMKTCGGGMGCNEFVFTAPAAPSGREGDSAAAVLAPAGVETSMPLNENARA